MDRNWKLGDDLIASDNLLDGFTFKDVIDALHTWPEVNEKTATRVLYDMLAPRLQDMHFLFSKNLDAIIKEAKKGREIT